MPFDHKKAKMYSKRIFTLNQQKMKDKYDLQTKNISKNSRQNQRLEEV